MKDDRITVRFSPELCQRLKNAARRSGKRESDVVRGAAEEQLSAGDAAPTAYELSRKSGLIGIVRGASRDLSTIQGHFEGFGVS